MQTTINKHALGQYLIVVMNLGYSYDRQYEVFNDLYFHYKFRDVKRFLNMKEEDGVTECGFTFKASLETLEITLAIVEEYKYYDTSGLENIIKRKEEEIRL